MGSNQNTPSSKRITAGILGRDLVRLDFVRLGQYWKALVSLGQDERDWLASVKVGWPNKF